MPNSVIILLVIIGITTLVYIAFATYLYIFKKENKAVEEGLFPKRSCSIERYENNSSALNDREEPIRHANIIDYMVDNNSNKRLIVIKEAPIAFMMITKPRIPNNMSTFITTPNSDMYDFGFSSHSAMVMFDILVRCFDTDPGRFHRRTISSSMLNEDQNELKFDVYCTFLPFDSYIVNSNKNENQKPEVVAELDKVDFGIMDYSKIDKAKLTHFLPYATFKGVDMRVLLPKKDNMVTIYPSILIDNVVFSTMPFQNEFINIFERHGGSRNISKQNLYEIYFDFYDQIKKKYLKTTTKAIEGFIDDQRPAMFVVNRNVDGRLRINNNDIYKYMEVTDAYLINNSLLKVGDVIQLNGQTEKKESDSYTITSISRERKIMILETGFATSLDKYGFKEHMEINGNPVFMTDRFDKNVHIPNNVVYFTDLNKSGYVIYRSGAIVKVGLILPSASNSRGICISNPDLKTKAACESEYDVHGRPKGLVDVWDEPCKKDSDCPFFMANINYKNYRGACHNGYCEMPTGVTRVGYTKYQGKPFCHGCPKFMEPTCCEEQATPDYSYAFDWMQRKEIAPLQNISI